MFFTRKQINEWIRINYTGDNFKSPSNEGGNHYWASNKAIKRKLIEAKVLIDRWDNSTTDFIFHSSKESFIEDSLKDSLDYYLIEPKVYGKAIWGCKINFSNDCPKDLGIAIDLHYSDRVILKNGRHLTVFPMHDNNL